LYQRLCQVCDKLDDIAWRAIYINDGSQDDSMKIILEQCKKNPRFSLIELSRNFGHQAAITAGLIHADGDAVIFMDGDLQDPPELIPELLRQWQEGTHIVRAVRRSRKERGFRRLAFDIFHKVFTWISDFPVPPNSGIFGLIDKKAAEELKKFTEKNRFFPGVRSWVGFEQGVITYDRQERAAGEPKQSIGKLIRYALDAVFSFSYKPLRTMTLLGICISTIGFLFACFFVVRRLAGIEIAQTGFTTIITVMLFLGGVQLIAIGMLGEYLARIYDEVKQRPLYIVKNRYGIDPERDLTS
jgi:dolichol-phosphate mannosyltransferase